jgi:hypothetical protein
MIGAVAILASKCDVAALTAVSDAMPTEQAFRKT